MRRSILANEQIYHVFNRAVANEEVFIRNKELDRILELVKYYRYKQRIGYSKFKKLPKEARRHYLQNYQKTKPIVEIYAYAFMTDHFHFLLKQLRTNGIRVFLSNIQNGFAKYFNTKNNRNGSLFQRPFKSKRIATDKVFLHVSRYIHLNPITSYLIEYQNLNDYPWTSYLDYLGRKSDIVNTKPILSLIGSRKKYEEFVRNQLDYQRSLNKYKHSFFNQ